MKGYIPTDFRASVKTVKGSFLVMWMDRTVAKYPQRWFARTFCKRLNAAVAEMQTATGVDTAQMSAAFVAWMAAAAGGGGGFIPVMPTL